MRRFFRSVGTRLSLALLLVVAAALGIVYLAVVPSLESRLENTRVAQLTVATRRLVPEASDASDTGLWGEFVDTAAHDGAFTPDLRGAGRCHRGSRPACLLSRHSFRGSCLLLFLSGS